jgi:hypothetical protein
MHVVKSNTCVKQDVYPEDLAAALAFCRDKVYVIIINLNGSTCKAHYCGIDTVSLVYMFADCLHSGTTTLASPFPSHSWPEWRVNRTCDVLHVSKEVCSNHDGRLGLWQVK